MFIQYTVHTIQVEAINKIQSYLYCKLSKGVYFVKVNVTGTRDMAEHKKGIYSNFRIAI